MGATLSERYTSQQKGTVKMMTDYEKMRKDLMKVKLHLPLVEQELLTLLVHLSSSPVYSGVRVTRSLVLCVIFCRSLFLLLLFLLAILLSVLRYMDSDYPFGIFKLFLLNITILGFEILTNQKVIETLYP